MQLFSYYFASSRKQVQVQNFILLLFIPSYSAELCPETYFVLFSSLYGNYYLVCQSSPVENERLKNRSHISSQPHQFSKLSGLLDGKFHECLESPHHYSLHGRMLILVKENKVWMTLPANYIFVSHLFSWPVSFQPQQGPQKVWKPGKFEELDK